MSEVRLFRPRREVSARDNVLAFIEFCRDELTVFGEDLPFDSMSWDVTKFIRLKAKKSALRAVFSSWETVNNKNPSPMPAGFSSFAKSYFRYQHGLRPTKSIGQRVSALRALCFALQEHGGCDPSMVDASTLNRAAQLVGEKYSLNSAYSLGTNLEMMAEFMDQNRLVAVPLNWKCTLPRPTDNLSRVGEEFEAARQKKLPSDFELDTLARAFRAATESTELVVTSVAALMCSAPDRVNEVLGLREKCEVTRKRKGNEPAYGLRFWPSKGADPMVKWLIPSMSTVAQEALSRLRAQSEEARRVAKWYEQHPQSMYLPEHLSHQRGKAMSMVELADALFIDGDPRLTRSWCERNKVATRSVKRRAYADFADVEAVILGMLPRHFPYADEETGLRFSEALCIARRNEHHRGAATYRGVIEVIDQGFIATGLGNRSEHGFTSIFDSIGLFNEDGSPIFIRSHQFRHYLNTLAQAGGLSELDIAKWSGRKDIRQNAAYNHVSDRDIQARIAELKESSPPATLERALKESRISILPRERMVELNLQAGHTTDFGYCSHDFAMSPCQIHRDCMNCNEQICVKGDREGELNARATLEETTELLTAAQAADADGVYGASQWVNHQEITLERVRQLLDILDNPAVPVGAIIQLTHVRPASRLHQAAEARKALGIAADETPKLSWEVVQGELPQ